MKVIFLDIDGVLNSWAWTDKEGERESFPGWNKVDPEACARLNRIVEATGAKVVISSTWRKALRLSEIRGVLAKCGAKVDVIGATPVLWKPRGLEIQSWLDGPDDVEAFVILDDDADMEHLVGKLVQTSCATGLMDEHVDRAIAVLNGGHP